MNRIPDRIILGDNPFIGVEHLDQSRGRTKGGQLNDNTVRQTVATASRSGATAFMFSTHDSVETTLALCKEGVSDEDFGYYPLFPYAAKYARLATERGLAGIADEFLAKLGPLGGIRAGTAAGLGLVQRDPYRLLKAFTSMEIDPILAVIGPENLRALILHEVVVDLCLGLDAPEPLRAYARLVRDRYGTRVGLATRNFALLARRVGEWDLDLDVIVTPFNRMGFQMVPSKQACIEALDEVPPTVSVIAVSVLAAGLLDPLSALEYIGGLSRIDAVALGTSRPDHAEITFGLARRILGPQGV